MITPIQTVSLWALIFSTSYFLFSKTKFFKLFPYLLLLFSFFYFGFFESVLICLLLFSSLFLGNKIIKGLSSINFSFGLVINFLIFIIFSFVFGPRISLIILSIFQLLIIYFLRKYFKQINFSSRFNFFEILIISFSFILSSQPQLHWDAVHANLYVAKWYFLNNSLAPLTDSISSLFPQNAILYFTYFFGIGGQKALQVAYLLPLILSIFVFKQLKLNSWLSILLISTPIFIFESSNGYYDSLVFLSCLLAVVVFLTDKKITNKQIYLSALFIGFGAGVKYFPLALTIIPTYFILVSNQNIFNKLKNIFFIYILIGSSLLIWCFRSYKYTGNPFFPFAQRYFPQAQFWNPTDILENNFMIQTTMTSKNWMSGGFFTYPFITYDQTDKFIEAARGYTTRAPIIFNFISLIFIILLFFKFFTKKKVSVIEIVLLLSYFSFFAVGLFTRYYRYLWPFQTLISFLVIIIIQKYTKLKYLIFLFVPLLFISNTKNLGHPDYFQTNSQTNDPILFLNSLPISNQNDLILDASKYTLPRVHFSLKTTECNWYWINGPKLINEKNSLKDYKYFILSTDKLYQNYCTQNIYQKIDNQKPIYQDTNYLIFQL
jgi:hypothetical protein